MNIGMLWFDNDAQSDLAAKIERAVRYYQEKYGKRPNVCYVHPCMAPAPSSNGSQPNAPATLKAGGVEVRTTRSVLPNHLWIGVNGANGHSPS